MLATGNIFQGSEKEPIVSFLLSFNLSTSFTLLVFISFLCQPLFLSYTHAGSGLSKTVLVYVNH